jgi:hypothetical protein
MVVNRAFSILIISGMAIGSIQAAEVKQPIQYNKEATQKLQEKIHSMETGAQLLTSEFLTIIDKLITEGADPNIGYAVELETYDYTKDVAGPNKKIFSPLLGYLVIGPALVGLHKNLDLALIETVTKNALKHGADPNTQDDMAGLFGKSVLGEAIHRGSPAQVQMLLDHGATLSGIQTRRGDIPEVVLARDIMILKDALPHEKNPSAYLRTQNDIRRSEQILNILKAAQRKS